MPDPRRIDPTDAGLLNFREDLIATGDGQTLVTWTSDPARHQSQRPVIIYFHGNAGHIADRAERLLRIQDMGAAVVIVAYRGYSGSTGTPVEADIHKDARRVYDRIVNDGTPADAIVLYGESLGTGVAVKLASTVPVGGIVLDAPYTSIADVGARAFPWLPVRLLMRDRFDASAWIGHVTAPVLILHGERDDVVPVAMGRELARQATSSHSVTVRTFPEAGHSDHRDYGSFDALEAWLAALNAERGRR